MYTVLFWLWLLLCVIAFPTCFNIYNYMDCFYVQTLFRTYLSIFFRLPSICSKVGLRSFSSDQQCVIMSSRSLGQSADWGNSGRNGGLKPCSMLRTISEETHRCYTFQNFVFLSLFDGLNRVETYYHGVVESKDQYEQLHT